MMEHQKIRRERRLGVPSQGYKPEGLDDYFEEIASQFRPYLQKVAFSILHDHNRAEDAASETFCEAHISISTVLRGYS